MLSTQNPVDLDYKALSNCGTWFIGRLQTERDKDRLLAGLEGLAAGGSFDKKRTEQILAGLGKRTFYLHNVHQPESVIFTTRWTMSYLAGPLTRNQISKLTLENEDNRALKDNKGLEKGKGKGLDVVGDKMKQTESDKQLTTRDFEGLGTTRTKLEDLETGYTEADTEDKSENNHGAPVLPPEIQQVYLPVYKDVANLTYTPSVIGVVEVFYNSSKHKLAESKNYTIVTAIMNGLVSIDWSEGEIIELELADLDSEPVDGASYGELSSPGSNPKNYDKWKKLLSQYVRKELPLSLYNSPTLKEHSNIDEDERDFRIRIQHLAHEKRDEEIDKLNKKYGSRLNTLENRLLRAQQRVEKQNTQASQKKVDAAVSIGSAVIGTLFGKKASKTSVSKFGTALKSTNRARTSGESVNQAEESLQSVELEIEELQLELEQEIEKISLKYDMDNEELETIEIRATANNITVPFIGLAWKAD